MSTSLFHLVPPGQYPFSVDLGVAIMTVPRGGFGFAGGAPVELVIYGSSTPCGRDQELARTTLIANTDSWATYSGVLAANQSFSNLVLVPTLANASTPGRAGAYVNIARFTLPSCH